MLALKFRSKLGTMAAAVLVIAGGGTALAVNASAMPGHHHHPPGPPPPMPMPPGGPSHPRAYLHQIADVTAPYPYINSTSYDISWVDPTTDTYYLADRANNGILSINATTDTFNTVIGKGDFTGASPAVTGPQTTACGTSEKGPNGVLALTVGGVNQVWAADGVDVANQVSNVKVFIPGMSMTTPAMMINTNGVATNGMTTNGTCRADEMAYDPQDQLVAVANDVDPTPYLSFISVNATATSDAVVFQIEFPEAVGVGIEQTVWDPETQRFYTNIPGKELAVIDPVTQSVVAKYPSPAGCTAQGLALDEQTQQLLLSCGLNPNGVYFLDAHNGSVTANFPQVSSADEVWFDPGTQDFYLAASKMTSTGAPLPTIATAGAGTAWSITETGATSGTFTLTAGTTTASLPYNATAGDVQTALPGTTVTGGPLPTNPLNVTFGSPPSTFTANGADLQPGGYVNPVLGVISGDAHGAPGQLRWLENVPTGLTTYSAHSVAVDPNNGEVFVPLQGVGVIVFAWTK